jgi:hypothetical protein
MCGSYLPLEYRKATGKCTYEVCGDDEGNIGWNEKLREAVERPLQE